MNILSKERTKNNDSDLDFLLGNSIRIILRANNKFNNSPLHQKEQRTGNQGRKQPKDGGFFL